jgi:hypothetical protein
MEELQMKKQYSLSNLISGRHYDYDLSEWIDTPIEYRIEALNKFKEYLLTKTRKSSRANIAIYNMGLDNFPKDCGIFRRLIIDETRDNKVSYIAGQDEIWEMNVIKKEIIKHCY